MFKSMLAAVLALGMSGPVAQAAAPLDGPLTIVVGYAPGGSSDRIARLVAERLKDRVGVPVIVENKTGAGGRIAAQALRQASAQQNVLMLANPAVMVVAPLVYAQPGYDAQRDFQPLSLASRYKFALTVPAGSPLRTLADLRQWIAAHPKQLTVGCRPPAVCRTSSPSCWAAKWAKTSRWWGTADRAR